LGDKKGIWPVKKIMHQQTTKVLWQTYRRSILTWSDLWKNRPVKKRVTDKSTICDYFSNARLPVAIFYRDAFLK